MYVARDHKSQDKLAKWSKQNRYIFKFYFQFQNVIFHMKSAKKVHQWQKETHTKI